MAAARLLATASQTNKIQLSKILSILPAIVQNHGRQQSIPFSFVSSSITIPSFSISISGILSEIWEGILKAVPKKKTSHMKKRHRQLAGKALKDVNAVNTCPGCGKPKKAHHLCPYCVAEIKESWKQSAQQAATKLVK